MAIHTLGGDHYFSLRVGHIGDFGMSLALTLGIAAPAAAAGLTAWLLGVKRKQAALQSHRHALDECTRILAGSLIVDAPLVVKLRDAMAETADISHLAIWDSHHQVSTWGDQTAEIAPDVFVAIEGGGEVQAWCPTEQARAEVTSILEGFSAWLGASLSASRSYNLLRKQATTDPLTGLCNRRMLFFERQRVEETRSPLGLLLIDVNNLKMINDEYGHNSGDELICKVARALSASTRDSDTVVRLGGDEFLVIARGITQERMHALQSRLHEQLQSSPLRLPDGSLHQVTAAMGSSSYPSETTDWDELLSLADARMYRCKEKMKAGKNFADIIKGNAIA